MKSFRQKLLLLILPILICLVIVSGIRIYELDEKQTDLKQATIQLALVIENSLLVHELQKERGTTAGFIGAQGKQFASQLQQQYQATDKALGNVQSFWQLNKSKIDDPAIIKLQEQVFTSLSQLTTTRNKAQNLSIKLGEALAYYTGNNSALLSSPVIISDNSSDSHLTQQITAFYNFLQAKERAGIERAVLSNSFAAGKFGDGVFIRFIKLMTEQESYLNTFKAFADSTILDQYLRIERGSSFSEVSRFRDLALNSDLSADAATWFKAATVRINDIKSLEDSFALTLSNYAQEQSSKAFTGFVFWLVLLSVLISITLVFTTKILRDLNRQVTSIVKVMRSVSDDHNLSEHAQVIGKDELSQIAVYLNSMIDVLRSTMTTLSDVSIDLSSAAGQGSTVSAQNAAYLDQLHQQTEMITTAVEQLSISIAEVSQSTTQTVDAVNLVTDSSKDSDKAMEEAATVIHEVADEVGSISTSINNLHDSSQAISSVLEVIKNIADQTNLLALNAAIEAARAGEQGRGFAVVADEVRTLAQRTQESTVEIETIVDDFQLNARKAYEMMSGSKQKVDQSVGSAAVVKAGFELILDAIDKVVSSTHQVASATEEQTVVSRDIAEKIVEIDEHARETAKGGEQISQAAVQLAQLAERVKQESSQFKL